MKSQRLILLLMKYYIVIVLLDATKKPPSKLAKVTVGINLYVVPF